MNREQRNRIENHLKIIQLAVGKLAELLPREQSFSGSELQHIERLKNALYHKYVLEDVDKEKRPTETPKD